MKSTLTLSALLFTSLSWAAQNMEVTDNFILPGGLDRKCLEIKLDSVEQCTVSGRRKPAKWQQASYSPFIITFPPAEGNTFSASPWQVSFSPFTNGKKGAAMEVETPDVCYQITLAFDKAGTDGSYSGTAQLVHRAAGNSTHMRGATFCIRAASSADGSVVCPVPATLDGKQVYIHLVGAQEASAGMGEEPTQWKESGCTPLVLCFPAGAKNCYSYQLSESTPDSPWPPVEVTYNQQESAISITGNDMAVKISLSFVSPTGGTADFEWLEEGSVWYVRGASFVISASGTKAGLITLPQAEEEDGAIQSVDDGLRQLVLELQQTKYKTAVERLYQKRLLTLLPQIMEGGDINNVLSNANGTTALHNACGLSHVQIVQWLVDHGADLTARTAKGAGVDACVGGPNAKAIRAILRKARTKGN